jgi:acyl-CoA synthetase (NDP forming)
VVTNSGGLGRLATDACGMHRLMVPALDPATADRLRESLPRADRIGNPLDMGIHAAAADYASAVAALGGESAVDAILVLCSAVAGGNPEDVLAAVEAAGSEKCVVASVVAADGRLPQRPGWRVPNLSFPEAAVAALALAAARREWLSRPLGQVPKVPGFDAARLEGRVETWVEDGTTRWLTLEEAEELMDAAGIEHLPTRVCATLEEALAAAAGIDGTCVLKAHFPPPAHASDIDALLMVQGEQGITAGWADLSDRVRDAGREWQGVVVQPLAGAGADVLVGAVAGPDFGPLVGLGMGGRHASLSGDLAFRLAPLTDLDAEELIASSRAVRTWLRGFRGGPPLDAGALRDVLLRFSKLLEHVPALAEVDLNPVRLMPSGCTVLDVRMRVDRRHPDRGVRTW